MRHAGEQFGAGLGHVVVVADGDKARRRARTAQAFKRATDHVRRAAARTTRGLGVAGRNRARCRDLVVAVDDPVGDLEVIGGTGRGDGVAIGQALPANAQFALTKVPLAADGRALVLGIADQAGGGGVAGGVVGGAGSSRSSERGECFERRDDIGRLRQHGVLERRAVGNGGVLGGHAPDGRVLGARFTVRFSNAQV